VARLQAKTTIILSEKQKRILTEFKNSTHQPLHLKIRSEIVLRASEGQSNHIIKREMGVDKNTVRRWRDRFGSHQEQLLRVEKESPLKLRSTIIKFLSDAQRSGGPATYKDEQVAAIIAMACESPGKFDLPLSHWTPGMLRKKAIEIGIVDDISIRQVGRFLKGERFAAPSKPLLVKPKH
jgi:transposase-like protein